jgi:20S proteasome subunit alpha 2
VRPFGVSLLVAGYDEDGPHLFQVDPSGTFFGWKATAIGKNFKNARSFLERRYREDMELEDAIHTVRDVTTSLTSSICKLTLT